MANEQVITLKTADLKIQVEGAGASTVLLHGGPGLRDYLPTLGRLLTNAGVPVVRYTQRGTSASPSKGPFTVEAHVEDLEAIRARLGLDEMTLIGHSWGGGLALFYAMTYPRRVRRIVVITPMGMNPGWREGFEKRVRERLPEAVAERVVKVRETMEAAQSEADLNRLMIEEFRLVWPAFFYGKPPQFMLDEQSGRVHIETFADAARLISDEGFEDRLRSITQPVLVVYADHDLVPPESIDYLTSVLPNCQRVTIEHSGHFPWLEQPQGVLKAIVPFLRSS